MKNIEQKFASAVKKRRKEIGLSQEAFAAAAGIHRTYASSIERGKVQVSIAVADQIAKGLQLSLSELFELMESEA